MFALTNKLYIVFQYLKYFFLAKHRKGHGVHSPFVYEFVTKVLYSKEKNEKCTPIVDLTKELRKSSEFVAVEELGGGSIAFKGASRKLPELVKHSSVREKYGRLLTQLMDFYKPKNVLEIGTSIGVSTMFLASGYNSSKIYTIEGNKACLDIARNNCERLELTNVFFIHGLFDNEIQEVCNKVSELNMVFVDGNHSYDATLRYYKRVRKYMNQGFIIFDDIYWSKGMQRAWSEIKEQEEVTIDIFQFGIVVIREQLTKGNYRIRY